MRTPIFAAVALFTLCSFTRAEEEPEVMKVDPLAIIRGSVGEDRGAAPLPPAPVADEGEPADQEAINRRNAGLIVDADSLRQLWETWEVGEKMPEVDFTRQFVVTTTWGGTRQDVSWMLLPDGRFVFGGGGTKDIRPGFRYTIGVFSREGVRTVNGAALPKVEMEDAAKGKAGTGEDK